LLDVVICGSIRSELSTFAIVDEIYRAREAGLVRQVVFSTWQHELEAFPRLRESLNRAGFTVVGNQPPPPDMPTIIIQHMQLWRGLLEINDNDSLVLRTRTDKSFFHTISAIQNTPHIENKIQLSNGKTKFGFSAPIFVPGVSVNELFAHNDLLIIAKRNDFLRILNFDDAYNIIFTDAGRFPQEARWFMSPFLTQIPTLKNFVRNVNIKNLSIAISRLAESGSINNMPDSILKILVCYWECLSSIFSCIDYSPLPGPLPLIGLLGRQKSRPYADHWGERLLITSNDALDSLYGNQIDDDEISRKISDIKSEKISLNELLDKVDCDEINEFISSFVSPQRSAKIPTSSYPLPEGVGDSRFDVLADFVGEGAIEPLMRGFYEKIGPAIEKMKKNGGFDSIRDLGVEIGESAIKSGSSESARMAHLCLAFCISHRDILSVDAICELAFNKFPNEAHQKWLAVQLYVMNEVASHNRDVQFWYGLERYRGVGSPENKPHGISLIRRAADNGLEKAIIFMKENAISSEI